MGVSLIFYALFQLSQVRLCSYLDGGLGGRVGGTVHVLPFFFFFSVGP